MKLISKNVDVFVAILACVVAMLGCTRQDNAARRLDEGLSQVTTEKVKATPPHDATKPSETPGRMVAPPNTQAPGLLRYLLSRSCRGDRPTRVIIVAVGPTIAAKGNLDDSTRASAGD